MDVLIKLCDIETGLQVCSNWTCQRDWHVFNADENLAAVLFGFCQHDCLIGATRGELTASQQRLAVFGVSQQLHRAATDLSCHLTLRCLFFLSFLSSSLRSVPARVWSLCRHAPPFLVTRRAVFCCLYSGSLLRPLIPYLSLPVRYASAAPHAMLVEFFFPVAT